MLGAESFWVREKGRDFEKRSRVRVCLKVSEVRVLNRVKMRKIALLDSSGGDYGRR